MNIFYLDHDPVVCATMHNNSHTVKMILEYAQITCTAHRILDGDLAPDWIYKLASKNHPSVIWARTTSENYMYVARLLRALSKEYTHRYGKVHATELKGIVDFVQTPPLNIPIGDMTPVYLAMPDHCKTDSPIESYKRYYLTEKRRLLKYKNRPYPDWVLNAVDSEVEEPIS